MNNIDDDSLLQNSLYARKLVSQDLFDTLPDKIKFAKDEALLQFIQNGSPKDDARLAFMALMYHHDEPVWLYAKKFTHEQHANHPLSDMDIDDVMQNVWVTVLKKISSFKWRGTSIRSWLCQIAQYKVQELFKSKKRLGQLTSPEENQHAISKEDTLDADTIDYISSRMFTGEGGRPHQSPDEVQDEADRLIHKFISELKSDTHRKIIKYRYFRNLTFKEIAEVLDITPVNARVSHTRAIKKLEKFFEQYKIKKETV